MTEHTGPSDRPLGQHFTLLPVARTLVRWALGGLGDARPATCLDVADPACGDGAFLAAAALELGAGDTGRRVGVDLDPRCVAAASQRPELAHAELVEGDALRLAGQPPLAPASFDLVVLNPPYIGEKGNAALFDAVRQSSPLWASRSVARMDYLYYFLHLGLDLLRPGGRMVALTTAYWPSATSASMLRDDLVGRGRILWFIDFTGEPLFADARGQDNLAIIVERRGPEAVADTRDAPYGWRRVAHRSGSLEVEVEHKAIEGGLGAGVWQPFASSSARAALVEAEATTTPLGALARDRQGVVTGADRLSRAAAARLGLPAGAPVFCLSRAEIEARGWHRDPALAPFLEPLLRGSALEPLSVFTERRGVAAADGAPDDPFMVYLDGTRPVPKALLAHLAPVRSVLEARREVVRGVMPWYRVHWPRDRTLMALPKLVTARRGAAVKFALDLGGHVVNSDCTCVMLADGLEPDALATLLVTLHSEEVAGWLDAAGKRKGRLHEFYSEPLRRLRVPLRAEGATLVATDPGAWRRQVAALRQQGRLDALDRAFGAGWFDKALPT